MKKKQIKKYKIQFTHIVEITYEVEIEANSEKEAIEEIEENAFDYEIQEIGEQGIEIKNIIIIKK